MIRSTITTTATTGRIAFLGMSEVDDKGFRPHGGKLGLE